MQQVELNLETAVMATLGTVLIIGLGFLRNPSRASRLWALAFMVVMLGAYGALAAEVIGADALRAGCLGVILAAPTLLWSGVRSKFGKPSWAWVGLVQGGASAALLVLLDGTPWYTLGFRFAFAGAAVFAALTAMELITGPQRGLGMLLPLTVVSALFPALAFTSLVLSLRALTDGSDDLSNTETINVLAMPVYLVCAIVSLLYLSGAETDGRALYGRRFTRASLNDRLARAEAQQDTSWSLLYINLDDVLDIRLAVGDAAFEAIVDRFAADVRAAFPTEADIEFRTDTTALVLLTRPEVTIRANVRSLLNTISTLSPDQPLAVQLAASVGWATTGTTGFRFDDLVRAASAAAVDARLAGGDRWVRVESTDPAQSSRQGVRPRTSPSP